MKRFAFHPFLAGVRDELPLLVGVFPFGIIYGALAVQVGIPASAAQAMSLIVFAGSSQFAIAQLVHQSASAAIIVLTVAVINLRHLLYSASLAPYLKRLPLRYKMLLSYLMTDEAYAVAILNYQQQGDRPQAHQYYLGAGFALWFTWQISTALGLQAGTFLPAHLSLEFALPLTFIAMLVPVLRTRPLLASALSAGLIAVLARSLPYQLGLILAALTGILIGVAAERFCLRERHPHRTDTLAASIEREKRI